MSQIIQRAFNRYDFDETQYGSNIFSVVAKGDFIWAGTEKGLLKLDHKGSIINYYGTEHGLPGDKITALVASGNDIWMGTESHGVYMLKDKSESAEHYPIATRTA